MKFCFRHVCYSPLVNNQKFLQEGMCYRVGNGRHIQIWRDLWAPLLPRFQPTALEGAVIPVDIVTVGDLLLEDGVSWNVGLVNNVFSQDLADAILNF